MSIIERIINSVSIDPRVKDGIFEISNVDHMDALRDHLINRGIPVDEAVDFCNRVVEGKHPERQAYNKNGILVTFPTPEYKQRAIQRGTHFEKKPATQNNLFTDPDAPKSDTASAPAAVDSKPEDNKTSLPLSAAAPSTEQPPATATPTTTAAPQSSPSPEVPAEPVKEPTELPEPEPKSSQEKDLDAIAIKNILQSDSSLLQEVSLWVENNGPKYILELLSEKRKSKD